MEQFSNLGDLEFQRLVDIAVELSSQPQYKQASNPWRNSPFEWLLRLPSRRRGKAGEELVERWCKKLGLEVQPCRDRDADRIIAGKRVEIKFSMLWEKGEYVFQQFRKQNYEYALCLGISPRTAHCWIVPKSELFRHLAPQHTGKEGSETFWLRVKPHDPPDWLRTHGGSLSDAANILHSWRQHDTA